MTALKSWIALGLIIAFTLFVTPCLYPAGSLARGGYHVIFTDNDGNVVAGEVDSFLSFIYGKCLISVDGEWYYLTTNDVTFIFNAD